MGPVNRVYVARLARMLVLGPMGENFGRVRDVVISISIVRQQPRVLGLVVDLATRRSIFIPILRVAAIEPNAVTLNTGNVSLRHFEQRPGEVLAIGQMLDTPVKVNDPELPELVGLDVVITDLGIEQSRTRDWMVTRIAVRSQRRLGRRGPVHVVDWQSVQGLTPSALAMPGQAVAQLLGAIRRAQSGRCGRRHPRAAAQAAHEVLKALNDDRLADILQELPEVHRAFLRHRTLPADADDPGAGMDCDEPVRGDTALGLVPVYPAQSGLLHAGRLSGAADPAGPEPSGEPGPGRTRRRSSSRRTDQGRHRVSGPRAGRPAAGRRRGSDPGIPASTSSTICAPCWSICSRKSRRRRPRGAPLTTWSGSLRNPGEYQIHHCATPVTGVMYGDLGSRS